MEKRSVARRRFTGTLNAVLCGDVPGIGFLPPVALGRCEANFRFSRVGLKQTVGCVCGQNQPRRTGGMGRINSVCSMVTFLRATLVDDLQTRSAPWSPGSWRNRPAYQLPSYPDPEELASVEQTIRGYPGLVTPAEIQTFQEHMAAACLGEAFVIQGGDCAETFSGVSLERTASLYHLLTAQAALIHSAGTRRRIIRIGRVAGQFAKPRSTSIDSDGLSSFRGDIVHSATANETARTPDPQRLIQAYQCAATSLEHLETLARTHRSPKASLERLHERLTAEGFVAPALATAMKRLAQDFSGDAVVASGRSERERDATVAEIAPTVFASHEALLLPYEESLVRSADEAFPKGLFNRRALISSKETNFGKSTEPLYYATSGHFLWIGERTRQLNAAHIEFIRGISNPIGVKLSGNITLEELFALVEMLNPGNTPGRLTLITRMGTTTLQRKLPSLMAAVRRAGLAVIWMCDPMHANTITVQDSRGRRFKTRDYESIQDELQTFFEISAAEGVSAGGIHLEMSGELVTECLGGVTQTRVDDLARAYHSACDPRLNYAQALSVASATREYLRLADNVSEPSKSVASA